MGSSNFSSCRSFTTSGRTRSCATNPTATCTADAARSGASTRGTAAGSNHPSSSNRSMPRMHHTYPANGTPDLCITVKRSTPKCILNKRVERFGDTDLTNKRREVHTQGLVFISETSIRSQIRKSLRETKTSKELTFRATVGIVNDGSYSGPYLEGETTLGERWEAQRTDKRLRF